MKTDERMAERITHLESDIKILKNEVQAVLVDLRDKCLVAENPFNTPSAPDTSQTINICQVPATNEVKSGAESSVSSLGEQEKEKTEEPPKASEPVIDKAEEPAKVSEAAASEPKKEKAQEAVRASEPEKEKLPGAAREATKSHIPEEGHGDAKKKNDSLAGRDIDLIRIVGLANWAEESVKKLGYQKTEAILDVAELMGLLSPEIKQIMAKLINIDKDGKAQSFSVRIFLDSLVKITTLLGKDNQTETALLTILSREDDPWIR